MALGLFLASFQAFMLTAEAPVIRLDDVYIQGNVRRPPLIELEGSKLDQKVEETALNSLIRLEKRLLEPASLRGEGLPKAKNSGK